MTRLPQFYDSKTGKAPATSRGSLVTLSTSLHPCILWLCTAADGNEVQGAFPELVGRSTVPQVFIGGEHIGGCDGGLRWCSKLGIWQHAPDELVGQLRSRIEGLEPVAFEACSHEAAALVTLTSRVASMCHAVALFGLAFQI